MLIFKFGNVIRPYQCVLFLEIEILNLRERINPLTTVMIRRLGKQTISFIVVMLVLPAVIFMPHAGYASGGIISYKHSCESMGGSWSSGINECNITNLTLNNGETLTVNAGITVIISGTLTNSNGHITNFGTLVVTSGSVVESSGTINNLGTIHNSGSFNNNYGSTFSNSGTVENTSGGHLNNSDGTINNNSAGIITNDATSVINNSGTINNYGLILNYDNLCNNSGGKFNNFAYLRPDGISDCPVTRISSGGKPADPHASDDPLPDLIKPSFGAVGNMIFPDGLTIGSRIYGLGSYESEVPKNTLDVNQSVTITIKHEPFYGVADWKHVAIYMNFEGKDPATYNANLVLSDDKVDGPSLYDPKNYIKSFDVATKLDSQYVYTSFNITAAKIMPDTSMIVSAWDDHKRINNIFVKGAIQFGKDPVGPPLIMSPWIHRYHDFSSIEKALQDSGYKKPLIFSRITNPDQVWMNNNGSLSWILDDKNKTVSIKIADKNDNTVFEKTEQLRKEDGIYSHCNASHYCGYSWLAQGELSRTDPIHLEKVKKSEEARVYTTLGLMGYSKYFDNTIR